MKKCIAYLFIFSLTYAVAGAHFSFLPHAGTFNNLIIYIRFSGE